MDEHKVVLVDPEDNVLGVMDKLEAHVGAGHLHRAVSVCLFDEAGRVLLQRRAWMQPVAIIIARAE